MFDIIDEKVFGSVDPEQLRHAAPDGTSTLYVPRSGDGDIDAPHGDDHETSVYRLDKQLGELNANSVNYQPSRVGGHCNDGCGGGCEDAADDVPDPTEAVKKLREGFQAIIDCLDQVEAACATYAGEMWVDRVSTLTTDPSHFDFNGIKQETNEVYKAIGGAVEESRTVLQDSLAAVRVLAKAIRDDLAYRAEARWKPTDVLGFTPWGLGRGALLAGFGFGGVGSLFQFWKLWRSGNTGPEDVQTAMEALKAAAELNNETVAALIEAVDAWDVSINGNRALYFDKAQAALPEQSVQTVSSASATPPSATPVGPGAGGVGGPVDLDESEGGIADKLKDALGDAFGGMPQMPQMPTMPGAGGMPDMGGMSPLGAPTDPFSQADDLFGKDAESPLDDETDEDVLTDESDTPLDEDEDEDALTDESENPITDDAESGDDVIDEMIEEDKPEGSEAPVESEPVVQNVAATVDPAAAAAQPTGPFKATLADGREIEVPTAKAAMLISTLAGGTEEAPISVYTAASAAGYEEIGGEGSPIGTRLSGPQELAPGDVIVSSEGRGVFIGDDQVLCEDGTIRSPSALPFGVDESTGIFRLPDADYPDDLAPSADAASSDDLTGTPGAGNAAPLENAGTGDTIQASASVGSVDESPSATEPITDTAGGDSPSLDPDAAAFDPMNQTDADGFETPVFGQ